ncbi:MAG: saccharopine dehydrogenase NADP-binding domain-containing protein [Planctomycetota bacterium]|nr:saccharopine dehydrogenase NADP-binding domain-containing protein [Planctomycetota bacterium]
MADRKTIVVLGSGKVGRLVTWFLADCGDYQVVAVDMSEDAAQSAVTGQDGQPLPNATCAVADIGSEQAVANLLRDNNADYVLSCAPFHCNPAIAKAAVATETHYLDLTEDVAVTKQVHELSEGAKTAFIPQCGLAPGFISIVANDLAKRFDKLDSLKMRVGALPIQPHNRLNYNLTWSTEGLINEYRHPCEAVVGGKLVTLPPLEDCEAITIDGLAYEAFNTSGGLGSLAETLAGKVNKLDYKSIRYPGHRDILKILMDDLKLHDDPDTMKMIFERALPYTFEDVVLVVVTAAGMQNGRYCQESYVNKIYNAELAGQRWSGIQITTASGLCAVLDLHASGKLSATGFVCQEEVDFGDFLANRFGKHYAMGATKPPHVVG